MTDVTVPAASNDVDRRYPPIAWLSTGALLAIVSGGISWPRTLRGSPPSAWPLRC